MVQGLTTDDAAPGLARRQRGRIAHLSGAMAEEGVTRFYLGRGATLLARRWRGKAGEIDIIFREGPDVVFVEVKASATHAEAAQSLQPRQMRRIAEAACEYCQRQGWEGPVPMRIDVALVDGHGRVELIPNAFGEM